MSKRVAKRQNEARASVVSVRYLAKKMDVHE